MQQEELWAAMEPEAAAAFRARQEEERAAAEAATRRQVLQVGARPRLGSALEGMPKGANFCLDKLCSCDGSWCLANWA